MVRLSLSPSSADSNGSSANSKSNGSATGSGNDSKSRSSSANGNTKKKNKSNSKKIKESNPCNNAININNITTIDPDPHNIEYRFVREHRDCFEDALREVQNGRKVSCWSWFVLPTAPYVVDGVERGSTMNRSYALRGDDAVQAYLTFETTECYSHPNGTTNTGTPICLRDNYISIVTALRDQLSLVRYENDSDSGGNDTTNDRPLQQQQQQQEYKLTLNNIMGDMDDVKAISSIRLFERIGRKMGDKELYRVCGDVLECCGQPRPHGEKKKGILRGWLPSSTNKNNRNTKKKKQTSPGSSSSSGGNKR